MRDSRTSTGIKKKSLRAEELGLPRGIAQRERRKEGDEEREAELRWNGEGLRRYEPFLELPPSA